MSDRQDDSPGEYQPPDGEVFDALQESYKNALSRLERLPELDMQVAVLDETLRSHSPKEAAWWLDQLMRGSLWGQSPVIDAMLAASRWLIQKRLDDDYDLFKTIFQAAYDDGRKPVLSIMRDPPPHRELPEGKRLPEPDLPTESDAPAGKRRELARGNNRLIVERLLLDPNALVIEQLLDNPNLRQSDVLLVASRRPNTVEILRLIALHKRWYVRREVRHALVMNPYNATGISLKLLPTLGIQRLRRVRNSTHLHSEVTEAAGMLVELREEKTAPWRV